jgi:hypothetical protein
MNPVRLTVRKSSVPSVLLLLATSLALLTSACLTAAPLTPLSPLTVVGSLDSTPVEVVEARIILSRGKHMVETTVPVQNNEFQGVLQVPIGNWELTVFLVDAEGMVHFQSKPQPVEITYGRPTTVELVLQPAASTVHITIDLDGYIFRKEALRARIYFNDDLYEVIREDADAPFEATLEISPGSYEFKIELYTETFHVGNRLGVGIWQLIDIAENEEVSITWRPETEDLFITGRVDTLLPAPAWLNVNGSGPQVEITWAPVEHLNLQGYIVLAKNSPLERFQPLNSIPIPTTSFLHTLDPEDLPSEIRYVVAAVSMNGFVGYYSTPQIWSP